MSHDATHTVSPDWHNENALRAYPLVDGASAASRLPAWLVTDLRLTVPTTYETVFLSSAYFSATLVSVAVSGIRLTVDAEGHETRTAVGLLARTVTRDELAPYRTYALDRLSPEACGTVAFGAIPADAEPFKLVFTADEAPLCESALDRVAPAGVTALVDRAHGTEADGIIDLSGNSEFRSYLDPSDPTGKTVILELADLYRDVTTSVCSSAPTHDRCGETPVKTVSGVAPDVNGTLKLLFR